MSSICNISFYEPYKSGCLIRIKLTPNASFCGFKGFVADADGIQYLKAYVRSVPEKGKANDELIKLLAKTLKLAKNNISIIGGATEHYKKIYIEANVSQNEMCELISKLAENAE